MHVYHEHTGSIRSTHEFQEAAAARKRAAKQHSHRRRVAAAAHRVDDTAPEERDMFDHSHPGSWHKLHHMSDATMKHMGRRLTTDSVASSAANSAPSTARRRSRGSQLSTPRGAAGVEALSTAGSEANSASATAGRRASIASEVADAAAGAAAGAAASAAAGAAAGAASDETASAAGNRALAGNGALDGGDYFGADNPWAEMQQAVEQQRAAHRVRPAGAAGQSRRSLLQQAAPGNAPPAAAELGGAAVDSDAAGGAGRRRATEDHRRPADEHGGSDGDSDRRHSEPVVGSGLSLHHRPHRYTARHPPPHAPADATVLPHEPGGAPATAGGAGATHGAVQGAHAQAHIAALSRPVTQGSGAHSRPGTQGGLQKAFPAASGGRQALASRGSMRCSTRGSSRSVGLSPQRARSPPKPQTQALVFVDPFFWGGDEPKPAAGSPGGAGPAPPANSGLASGGSVFGRGLSAAPGVHSIGARGTAHEPDGFSLHSIHMHMPPMGGAAPFGGFAR